MNWEKLSFIRTLGVSSSFTIHTCHWRHQHHLKSRCQHRSQLDSLIRKLGKLVIDLSTQHKVWNLRTGYVFHTIDAVANTLAHWGSTEQLWEEKINLMLFIYFLHSSEDTYMPLTTPAPLDIAFPTPLTIEFLKYSNFEESKAFYYKEIYQS